MNDLIRTEQAKTFVDGDSRLATPSPPSSTAAALLIARRGAIESLKDRSTTLVAGLFSVVLPIGFAFTTIGPRARDGDVSGAEMAAYLLFVGLMPSSAAIGSAAGQFAGEKEVGNLTPLLASPTSNTALFAGKVLGAVGPSLFFSLLAELAFVGSLAVFETGWIRDLPFGLTTAMLALLPAVSVFAATMTSFISSRVRTYNSAQQLGGLALAPFWGLVVGLGFAAKNWGNATLVAMVCAFYLVDAILIWITARTWRREEVLARR